MILAVSMRIVSNDTYPEQRDAISHDWINFLEEMGVTPVFVPNLLHDPVDYIKQIGASGLILTGGNDIGAIPLETRKHLLKPSQRDSTEHTLLSHSVANNLPIFGVCRGLQMINIFFDGGLTRDLSSVGTHANTKHKVEIVQQLSSRMREIDSVITNSYHNQGVLLRTLSPHLKAFALAAGDVVEGLYHPNKDIVAVQWHPERPNPASDLDHTLFEDWLTRCV